MIFKRARPLSVYKRLYTQTSLTPGLERERSFGLRQIKIENICLISRFGFRSGSILMEDVENLVEDFQRLLTCKDQNGFDREAIGSFKGEGGMVESGLYLDVPWC